MQTLPTDAFAPDSRDASVGWYRPNAFKFDVLRIERHKVVETATLLSTGSTPLGCR
jgi:hypothetical protein